MTKVEINYITDDKLRLLLEDIMPGGPSSLMGNRHVRRRESEITYGETNNLYGATMSPYSPTGDSHEIDLTEKKKFRNNLKKFR